MPAIRWQFVCEPDLSSRTIAWFSAGHLSHVDCVIDNDWHNACEGYLLGARDDRVGGAAPGVHVRTPEYARFIYRTVMRLDCTHAKKEAFIVFMHEQIGKPYDSAAIWGFAFNRNWRTPDSWICSELQAAAAEVAGLTHKLYLAANKITPVAWALALSAAGAVVESQT